MMVETRTNDLDNRLRGLRAFAMNMLELLAEMNKCDSADRDESLEWCEPSHASKSWMATAYALFEVVGAQFPEFDADDLKAIRDELFAADGTWADLKSIIRGKVAEAVPVRRGGELKNGAVVIDAKRIGPAGTFYVLALWGKGHAKMEYVTWEVDREGNASQGHYFPDLVAAVQDLASRG